MQEIGIRARKIAQTPLSGIGCHSLGDSTLVLGQEYKTRLTLWLENGMAPVGSKPSNLYGILSYWTSSSCSEVNSSQVISDGRLLGT